MRIIAYLSNHPLLDKADTKDIWGVEIDQVYEDWGSDQQLQQLLTDCQLKPPDYLLIRCLNELGKTLTEIGDRLQRLEGLGIEILAIEQDYSTSQFQQISQPEARQRWLALTQSIAKQDQQNRQKQGHARNRHQGLPPPGRAPYGYRRTAEQYVIDKTTAPILRDFFDYYLRYGSLRAALRHLEQQYGKRFSVSTGQRWLTHPVYRGDLLYANQEIIPNTHSALLSREEAAQIDRLLRRHRSFSPRTASAPHSLAGLVACQTCALPLTIASVKPRRSSQSYLYLRCTKCPRQPKCAAIAYEDLLSKIIQQICQELPNAVANLNAPDLDSIKANLQAKIDQKKQILEQIPHLIEQQIFDKDTAQLRAYQLKTEMAQLQSRLAQLPPGELSKITKAIALPQFWLDLSEIERRFCFREFIRQIQLLRSDSVEDKTWQLKLIFVF